MNTTIERTAGAGLAAANGSVFRSDFGREFRFNDHVCVEMLMGVPDEKRTGRLVQVRKGCGQFGSCVFLLRLRDGSLMAFENAMLRHATDKRFEDSFYRSNGRQPPVIPDQPVNDIDSETAAYSIGDKWPETGFIVETPSQPQTPGAFAMMVYTPNKELTD
jgi:hypothetical protein